MKRVQYLFLFTIILVLISGCNQTVDSSYQEAVTEMNIAVLRGPTAIGMVQIMENQEKGLAENDYRFEIYGSVDQIPAKIIRGEIDVAAVPANLASVLYNRTEGAVKVMAVNTLGVLHIVDATGEINYIEDLRGKTVYSTGKGTAPEFAFNYILNKNGMVPGEDLIVKYKSEATEIGALFAAGEGEIAVLPEPFVTTVTAANENVEVALSLTELWSEIESDFNLITGVVIVQNEFLQENEAAVNVFLEEYSQSVAFVNGNIEEAGRLTAEYGIVPTEAVAVKAIPNCNIVFIDGENMKSDVSGYLSVLYSFDETAIGGAMPGEDFYYIP